VVREGFFKVKQRAGPTPEQRGSEESESDNGDTGNLGLHEVIVSKFPKARSGLGFPISKLIMLRGALFGKARCLLR
jgi:hypothetical protein